MELIPSKGTDSSLIAFLILDYVNIFFPNTSEESILELIPEPETGIRVFLPKM